MKIKDSLKMLEPVQSTNGPEVERKTRSIGDVRNAVINFLKKTKPDVKQVNITKLAQIDSEKGTWEAEGEVFVPNPTIKALGLPIQKEVLECEYYLLRLDNQLDIVAYGLKESLKI